MILGIGFDSVQISRIESALKRFGERFKMRCFTDEEWALSLTRAKQAATLAKRFAAKEACAKALWTGIGAGICWQDIEVIKKESGAIGLVLHNAASKILHSLHIPTGFTPQVHVSLSDDETRAFAQVIVSAH